MGRNSKLRADRRKEKNTGLTKEAMAIVSNDKWFQGKEEHEECWVTFPSGLKIDIEAESTVLYMSSWLYMSEKTLKQVLKEYLAAHDFEWVSYSSIPEHHEVWSFLDEIDRTENVGDKISAYSIPSFMKVIRGSEPEIVYVHRKEVGNKWCRFICSFAATMRALDQYRSGNPYDHGFFNMHRFEMNYEDALYYIGGCETGEEDMTIIRNGLFEGIDKDFCLYDL